MVTIRRDIFLSAVAVFVLAAPPFAKPDLQIVEDGHLAQQHVRQSIRASEAGLTLRGRRLQGYPTDRVNAHLESASLFTASQGMLKKVGNVTFAQYPDASFNASTNSSGPSVILLGNGSWHISSSFLNADCASVQLQSDIPVSVFVLTTQAFTLLHKQVQSHPESVDPDLTRPPNAAGGESVWAGIIRKKFTVELDNAQSYLLAILNTNWTTSALLSYSISAASAAESGCQKYLDRRGAEYNITSNVSDSEVAAATYSFQTAQSCASYLAFTGMSCIAYGISYRLGWQSETGLALDSDILSTDVPRAHASLNTTLFLTSMKTLQAWGRNRLELLPLYSTGRTCTITSSLPGPCFSYVDGLDPEETYALWTSQGPAPDDPDLQFWNWQAATGFANGSCAEIWPVTPAPPRPPRAPMPPPPGVLTPSGPPDAAAIASHSNAGAIAGGVVGGVAGLTLLLTAVVLLLWRRRSREVLRGKLAGFRTGDSHYGDMYTGTTAYFTGRHNNQDSINFTELEDFKRVLSMAGTPRDRAQQSSFGSDAKLLGSRSLSIPPEDSFPSQISGADFSDMEKEFSLTAKDLPLPTDPQSQGICSIAEGLTPVKGSVDCSDAGSNYDALEDTWIIRPEDLLCKTVNGRPVLLGSGGFGSVWLGVLNRVREVAVKVVNSHSRKQQARFIREIKTLKACLDPNIVQFLGASVRGAQILMVMQYMPGGDLWTKLEHDTNGEYRWYKKGRAIATDICKGLCYLHSKHIAHLDLKSPNILLTEKDEAKISDVGLGKLIAGPNLNTTATQQGSFYWAAPEQLLGQPTTTASDMFSMGTVLWEICTGEQPRGRHLRKLSAPQEAPGTLVEVIARCLALEPSERPTAVELHDVILQS